MRNLTLNDCMELFFLEKEGICSVTTIKNYRNKLQYFYDFIVEEKGIKEIDINDITIIDLNRYRVALRKHRKFSNNQYVPTADICISNTTIHDYCVAVKSFFTFLYTNEYVANNIVKSFKIIAKEKTEIMPLNQDEVDEIVGLYNPKTETGARNLCILYLGLDAGLRSGEIVRLKDTDVNFNNNYIYIANSKGNKSRYVRLSRRLKMYLMRYKTVYRYPVDDNNAPFLFKIGTDKAITKDTIKMMFQRIKGKTDIERLYPHLLRHTFASSYMCGGGDLIMLSDLLGHSEISMTQKYVRMSNKQKILSQDIFKLENKFIKINY